MVLILYYVKIIIKKLFLADSIDKYLEKIIVGYYRLFPRKKAGIRERHARRKVIISLTTIPDRVGKVWITIESLLRQTYKPDEIILWLAKDEFANVIIPERLHEQEKRGLVIRYCDNLKSYKKFYYTAAENPDAYIVTVDDDIIYAENLLENLVKAYRKNPGCIICTRSHRMVKRNGRLLPYNSWITYEQREEISETPTYQNFFIGCGGTLFHMFLMGRKSLLDKHVFMDIAPTADDVWLNFNAWTSGLKVKNLQSILGSLILIESSSKKGLYETNLNRNKNDDQIRRVVDYLGINIDKYIN